MRIAKDNMENTLIVFAQNGTWMTDSKYTPYAATIQEVFGTTVLPTAFTTQISIHDVISELEALNPTLTVVSTLTRQYPGDRIR